MGAYMEKAKGPKGFRQRTLLGECGEVKQKKKLRLKVHPKGATAWLGKRSRLGLKCSHKRRRRGVFFGHGGIIGRMRFPFLKTLPFGNKKRVILGGVSLRRSDADR